MRRLITITCLGGLLLAFAVSAAEPAPPRRFEIGEKLSYRIFWGPVVVGNASLEVQGIDHLDGHPCYRVVARAETAGLGRLLYRVDSVITSWIDTEGLFSRRIAQQRTEGKHSSDRLTEYDYENMEAVILNNKNGNRKTAPLTSAVQDIVSSLYYLRAQPLALHKQETFTMNTGEKNWQVRARPDERRSLSLRPVGKVSALRIEPDPTLQIVAQNKGRMWFWISDDAQRVPLVVNSPMVIGTAKIVLHKIERPAVPPLAAPTVLGAR